MALVRLVALTRVSGSTQARDGGGLEDQEARIRAWARRGRHSIVRVCAERGISGSAPLEQRTGLAEALALLLDERADGLVVASLDRLSRDMVLQEQILAELTTMGAVLRSTMPGEDHALAHDEDDPSRALVRRILASIAAYERDMIRLRLRTGRERKAAAGGYTGGAPPYGWRAHGRELVPLAPEQAVRARIKRMRQGGASYQAIADALNSEGIPAKKGGQWSRMVVRTVATDNTATAKARPKRASPIRSADVLNQKGVPPLRKAR